MIKVMIAGIGGASLGTEIAKSLQMANGYKIYGCDISTEAYGLYQPEFKKTYLVDRDDYISDVIKACKNSGATWIIPGGEKTTAILGAAQEELKENGITFVANNSDVIRDCSDKARSFEILKEKGIPIPKTSIVNGVDDIEKVGLPCIIKPSTGSGGSAMVSYAADADEAMIYAEYIKRTGVEPLAQEYIRHDEGEFTIGVLSWPDQTIAGSVALQRHFGAKLSVQMIGRGAVVSSGYSQGYIADFLNLRKQAEEIAKNIGSTGPINVQGRVRDGVLIPFEINARFSASTYLRAMAGVNELDYYLQHLVSGKKDVDYTVKEGWYLRTLAENYISKAEQDEKWSVG